MFTHQIETWINPEVCALWISHRRISSPSIRKNAQTRWRVRTIRHVSCVLTSLSRRRSGSSWRCAARRVFCCGRRWMRGWRVTRGVFGSPVSAAGRYLCECAGINKLIIGRAAACVCAFWCEWPLYTLNGFICLLILVIMIHNL